MMSIFIQPAEIAGAKGFVVVSHLRALICRIQGQRSWQIQACTCLLRFCTSFMLAELDPVSSPSARYLLQDQDPYQKGQSADYASEMIGQIKHICSL